MTAPVATVGAVQAAPGTTLDLESQQWLAALRASGATRDDAVARLHELLLRAARFKAGFFQPRFTRLLIDALQQSAAIRAVMADLVAGEQAYGDLKWRLIKTLELRVAWRVFTATDSRHAHERGRLAG